MTEHEFSPEIFLSESKLNSIGLTPEMIKGKFVLDIHGDQPTFAGEEIRYLDTTISAINPDDERIEVEFPLPDDYIDYVLVTDGLLRESPWDPDVMNVLQESLRVLKTDGEIRILNPSDDFGEREVDPENWRPDEEIAYILSVAGEGVNVQGTMVSSDPDDEDRYLILKKMPSKI